jgi:hypothetical protein
MKKWDIVTVEWEDAYSTSADPKKSLEFVRDYKPCIRLNVGFFLHKDKDRIFICGIKDVEANADGDCEDLTVIPMGMVLDIQRFA